MASARKSENQSRIAAVNNARDAILERAEKDSERMMKGLLANPELTFALKSFDQILVILLKKGYKNELVTLSKDHLLGKEQKSQIRRAIAASEFSALCEEHEAAPAAAALHQPCNPQSMSATRARVELEFQKLCRAA